MYKQHFGLKDKPFNLIPDPDYLYLTKKHQMALSLLQYGLAETAAGLTVISGEVGAGKTTLIRKLMRSIDYGELTVGLINNTGSFQEELMSWVASAFGLEHEGRDQISMFRDFQQFLIDEYAHGRRTVLIVDEAQNLSGGALEQLRMLTNINADRDQLLQIVLVGQPELLDIFKKPEYAQIAQRVSVEFHLDALTLEETMHYIEHRMEVAGGSPDAFDDLAKKAIYYFSGGVPRLINTLSDYSLVIAYAMGKSVIDIEVASEVIKGRKIGGINRFLEPTEEQSAICKEIFESSGINLLSLIAA